jgi:protein-tyrosine-phosphatase
MPAAGAVLAFALVAAPEPQAPAPAEGPAVLFVCEHGAGRSPIAAAWFDRLAREKGLPHRAVARGTSPDAALSPAAREGLARDGFEASSDRPLPVTTDDLVKAQRIVVMGCPLPAREAVAAKVVDWDGVPGPGDGYDAARDDIRARVQKLVDELAGAPSP